MSYDISIGGFDRNYTHNSLGQLCYDHLNKDAGLQALHGVKGRDARQMLEDFWEGVHCERLHLYKSGDVGDPDLCAKYDAPNGWGSLVGALIFMGELTAACASYPNHTIRVSA